MEKSYLRGVRTYFWQRTESGSLRTSIELLKCKIWSSLGGKYLDWKVIRSILISALHITLLSLHCICSLWLFLPFLIKLHTVIMVSCCCSFPTENSIKLHRLKKFWLGSEDGHVPYTDVLACYMYKTGTEPETHVTNISKWEVSSSCCCILALDHWCMNSETLPTAVRTTVTEARTNGTSYSVTCIFQDSGSF